MTGDVLLSARIIFCRAEAEWWSGAELADALRAAGLAIVPVEPSEAMSWAGSEELAATYYENDQWNEAKDVVENLDCGRIYRAMLAACQETPTESKGGE